MTAPVSTTPKEMSLTFKGSLLSRSKAGVRETVFLEVFLGVTFATLQV